MIAYRKIKTQLKSLPWLLRKRCRFFRMKAFAFFRNLQKEKVYKCRLPDVDGLLIFGNLWSSPWPSVLILRLFHEEQGLLLFSRAVDRVFSQFRVFGWNPKINHERKLNGPTTVPRRTRPSVSFSFASFVRCHKWRFTSSQPPCLPPSLLVRPPPLSALKFATWQAVLLPAVTSCLPRTGKLKSFSSDAELPTVVWDGTTPFRCLKTSESHKLRL